MTDSFNVKGSGFGSTYLFKFLPFRIDFILADPEIEIKSHKNFKVRLSDHEPVMASFRLKE
jgi:endonuclease/exonuclease/phosphatase (EEP) superfamily protein YafD